MSRAHRRRLLLCLAALGAPSRAFAQLSGRGDQQRTDVRRIGYLSAGPPPQPDGPQEILSAFRNGLRQAGYEEGNNLVIEYRWAAGKQELLPEMLSDLLKRKVEVVVANSTVTAVVVRRANLTVPAVFMPAGAPVEIGLVKSLARPGGNMTGVTFEAASETYAKRLQLLKEIDARISRVGVLHAADDANVAFAMTSLEKTAPMLGLKLFPVAVRSDQDVALSFREMVDKEVQAVLVVAGSLAFALRKTIVKLAQQHRLPSMHGFFEAVADGGLISLGPDLVEINRRGGALVGMVLRGANPADIPVEQPTRYELHINLKTAKALGLKLPAALLARADKVIE